MTALIIAERNAVKTRELGKAGRVPPLPFIEGKAKVRRCTTCGHVTRFHGYDRDDPSFRGHPGTRWCQICTAFCPVERCTSGRAHRVRFLPSASERREDEIRSDSVLSRTVPGPTAVGGEAT
jgi:hypothetical protein